MRAEYCLPRQTLLRRPAMRKGRTPDPETATGTDRDRMARVRQQFEAAWEGALQGQSPPPLDSFLDRVPESERALLRGVLTEVEQAYRVRAAASSPDQTKSQDKPETVEVPARPQPRALDETLDALAVRAEWPARAETLDFLS